MELSHIPVMLNETIEGLNIKKNGIYVDCTMGGAGHSQEILKRLSPEGHLYCFDQDEYAIKRGEEALRKINTNYTIIKSNFVYIKKELRKYNISKVDGFLYDLGVSSFQFDIKDRGFSYNKNANLDMRMDQTQTLKAYDIVNYYSYDQLKEIFYRYGEEKFSKNIARKIIEKRNQKPIATTYELVEIIKEALPAFVRRKSGHPAKKVFQALRIAVNDELNVLKQSLNQALSLLNSKGRIVVISFHSLEDRICKQIFKEKVEVNLPRGLPVRDSEIIRNYRLVNNKVIIPSKEEIMTNHRAHSAKLRIIEKL